MNNHLRTPPSEVEIAEVLRQADEVSCDVIRRLAFERDSLKDNRKALEEAVLSAASSIIDNWEDWDAEAQQAAQIDEDYRSYRFVMLTNIVNRIWREFGWPTESVPPSS